MQTMEARVINFWRSEKVFMKVICVVFWIKDLFACYLGLRNGV